MLILTYSDGLGIYLDLFRQWIHQTAADGNGASDRHIVVRKFVAGDLGSRIDGSPLFADYKYRNLTSNVCWLIKSSVSRLAVPLPMEIASIW